MYKLVPVEATDQMLEDSGTMNGYDPDCGVADVDHRGWYATMLHAVPNPCKPIAEAEEMADVLELANKGE